MYSFWHSITLGRYNPQDRWVGLDYKALFLDPVVAQLTYFHEITHGILGTTTDFGQATQTVFQLLPQMKHISKDEREQIESALMSSQLFVQEGTATLMETLMHKNMTNKATALQWAKAHLPPDYYERLERLLFVFDMGNRYRDEFTKKIPNLALHSGIRKKIVELDLLSEPDKFTEYLQRPENNPDERFKKLIEAVKGKPYLPTKDVAEISELAGIDFYPDTSKQEVADFLNYLLDFTEQKNRFTSDDIGDVPEGQQALLQTSEQTIVGNMNLNLKETGNFLWDIKDILHYSDITEAILVSKLGDDLEYRAEMELITGRKQNAGLVAFTKTYDKYMVGLDFDTATLLLNGDYKEKTLIVKWGLYEPGNSELNYFPGSRKPNIVIYNRVANLQDKFKEWFSKGNMADYLYIGASENHPFQTLIIKESGVMHIVNTFGDKGISDFIRDNKGNLKKGEVSKVISEPKHLNNMLSVWMGLHWEVDWYESMLNGQYLVFRK